MIAHRKYNNKVDIMDSMMESPTIDFEDLVNRCLGNVEFAERVLEKFQARFDGDIEELEKALEADDAEGIARVAHRLKGASATAAANGIRKRASEIEDLARQCCVGEIPAYLRNLREECGRFSNSLSLLPLHANSN